MADYVRISYFGGLGMGRVGRPDFVDDGGIFVASLLDLAAAKAKVVQDRASARDYIDLDALPHFDSTAEITAHDKGESPSGDAS